MSKEKLQEVKQDYIDMRIAYLAKKIKKENPTIKKAELQRRIMQSILSDYGFSGKVGELLVRSFITGKKAKMVKAQGKIDLYKRINGKQYKIEIKTACGVISDIEKHNDLIIYCPHYDLSADAPDKFVVFTRQQWIDFINGYKGRGQFLTEKQDGLHIQSFYVSETCRPTASKPIANYIQEYCDSLPTVREFFGKQG